MFPLHPGEHRSAKGQRPTARLQCRQLFTAAIRSDTIETTAGTSLHMK
jgi:hypothetical protein